MSPVDKIELIIMETFNNILCLTSTVSPFLDSGLPALPSQSYCHFWTGGVGEGIFYHEQEKKKEGGKKGEAVGEGEGERESAERRREREREKDKEKEKILIFFFSECMEISSRYGRNGRRVQEGKRKGKKLRMASPSFLFFSRFSRPG